MPIQLPHAICRIPKSIPANEYTPAAAFWEDGKLGVFEIDNDVTNLRGRFESGAFHVVDVGATLVVARLVAGAVRWCLMKCERPPSHFATPLVVVYRVGTWKSCTCDTRSSCRTSNTRSPLYHSPLEGESQKPSRPLTRSFPSVPALSLWKCRMAGDG